jgi:pimeloyl-ACP methyl ester carboxylesterase
MQFFLIHGGWQGGWCWDGVVAELQRRGHKAAAPTLPGLEPGPRDRSGIGLTTMIAYGAAELVARDLTDVVLVGHSGGGSVVQGMLELVADRVSLVAYMSARILLEGECILDFGQARRAAYERAAASSPDNAVSLSEEVWIKSLCSDMSESDARSWLPKVVPNPMGWLTEKAHYPTGAWEKTPSACIFLDGERPEAKARYQAMAARLSQPRTTHCQGGHEAMLSQPVAVAEAILRVAGVQADRLP